VGRSYGMDGVGWRRGAPRPRCRCRAPWQSTHHLVKSLVYFHIPTLSHSHTLLVCKTKRRFFVASVFATVTRPGACLLLTARAYFWRRVLTFDSTCLLL